MLTTIVGSPAIYAIFRRQLHITQGFPLTGKKAQRIAAGGETVLPKKAPAETLAGVGEGEGN